MGVCMKQEDVVGALLAIMFLGSFYGSILYIVLDAHVRSL